MANEPELISAIFAGAGALVVATSKLTSDRSVRRRYQFQYHERLIETQEKTIQELEVQVVDAERHIFNLEQILARNGLDVPLRPESLKVKILKINEKGYQGE